MERRREENEADRKVLSNSNTSLKTRKQPSNIGKESNWQPKILYQIKVFLKREMMKPDESTNPQRESRTTEILSTWGNLNGLSPL